MRLKLFFCIPLFLAAASSSQAEVFKCVVGGRVSFQDTPCPGGGTVNIQPAAGKAAPAQPAASSTTPAAKTLSEQVKGMENERRKRELDLAIKEKTEYLQARQAKMTRELNALRAQQSQAANNLAGATWLSSISSEMQAITTQFNAEQTVIQAQINQLRAERASIP